LQLYPIRATFSLSQLLSHFNFSRDSRQSGEYVKARICSIYTVPAVTMRVRRRYDEVIHFHTNRNHRGSGTRITDSLCGETPERNDPHV